MATSSILKEMFYGLVASVGDNFSTIHITAYNIASGPRFSKSGVNQNHRQSRWYAPRLQGESTGNPTRALKQPACRNYFTNRRLSGTSLRLFVPATRKRVQVLLECQLLHRMILAQLVAYVRSNCTSIRTDCADIVPTAPEMPVPVLVFQVRVPVENHQGTLSLQIPHELRHTQVRRYAQKHVDMVGTCLRLMNLNLLQVAQLPQYPSYVRLDPYRISPDDGISGRRPRGTCRSTKCVLNCHLSLILLVVGSLAGRPDEYYSKEYFFCLKLKLFGNIPAQPVVFFR